MKTRQDFETDAEYIAHLESEQARLKAIQAKGSAIRLKVSDKGAVSVYGLGRFPVTLYKGQMIRFLSHASEIVAFMKEHDSELSEKPEQSKAA